MFEQSTSLMPTLDTPAIDLVERTLTPSEASVGVTVLTIEGEERAGQLVSICDDLTTAEVRTSPLPEVGEAVVFYLDSGMRFVATCRAVQGGVATLALKLSLHRAAQRGTRRGVRQLRLDEQRVAADDACVVRDMDGVAHDCRVLDISLTGLFVATEAKLSEGDIVRVGRAAAEVVRVAPSGYGMRLVKAGQRPVPNPAAKSRADRFAAARAPISAVA